MSEPFRPRHALSQRQRDLVTARLIEGAHHDAIKNEVGCSIGQIRKMSSNFRHFGTVTMPSVRKRGRPCLLTDEHMQVIAVARPFTLFRMPFRKTNFRLCVPLLKLNLISIATRWLISFWITSKSMFLCLQSVVRCNERRYHAKRYR